MPQQEPNIWTIVHSLRCEAQVTGSLTAIPAPEREAYLFAYVLEHLPVGLEPGETLAGDFGWRFVEADDRPSWLEKLAPLDQPPQPPGTATSAELLHERFHCSAGYTPAHTCADYRRVVEEGLDGVLAEVRKARAGTDAAGERMLCAMETALEAVPRWAARYADLARDRAERETDPAARKLLLRTAETCARVPRLPARTFHEALQAIWLVHAAIGISDLSSASLSLGRIDQFLYPLFRRDLERGLRAEHLERSLHDLWRKLNRFGDPACAVNLGGVDEAGRDLFNPLSAMIVRVTKAARMPAPILAARIHPGLPREAFDMLVDRELFTLGQPTFYGEVPCREAIVRRGVPAAQAHRYALNSCMGIVMPGEEISDMWGAVVNLLLPLELALNAGRPFEKELPVELETPPRSEFAGFDDLFEQFTRYLDEVTALLVARNRESTVRTGADRPNPFLSALTRDCIAKKKDRALGGARYHSIIVEGFGWCNAADALTAIRRLVFETKRYDLPRLVGAVRRDFEGEAAILAQVLRCPKYGSANEEADAMARRVTDAFARLVSRHSHDNVCYLPSYHTLNAHIGAGRKVSASLDGRRAGEPLGKNAGPMTGRTTEGLTAVLLSASSLDQRALSGGQALDISVDPVILGDAEGRRTFEALLLTYFARGGLQVQVNGMTAKELRAAIENPAAHQDLIVKIAGYSARFVTLGREVQEEMVQRFERGL